MQTGSCANQKPLPVSHHHVLLVVCHLAPELAPPSCTTANPPAFHCHNWIQQSPIYINLLHAPAYKKDSPSHILLVFMTVVSVFWISWHSLSLPSRHVPYHKGTLSLQATSSPTIKLCMLLPLYTLSPMSGIIPFPCENFARTITVLLID